MGTPVMDPKIAVSIIDTTSQYDNMVAGAVDDIIGINSIDTIDLGNCFDLSGLSITSGGTGAAGYVNTTVGTGVYSNTMPNSYIYGNGIETGLVQPRSGTIELNGDDADIRVNGESVMETLRWMKERLAWLDVRTDLESEWQELRELGDQYRAMVSTIEDKVRMWDTLKKMPPPVMP
jgi:hypothetical protein